MARRNGGFVADFREFITKGDVVDLAVAVIIGGAFGKIIESLVADIITPAILNPALEAANVKNLSELVAGNGIKYGSFLAAVINFLVIAFSIFLMIRAFENAKKKLAREKAVEEAVAPDPAVLQQQQTVDALNRLSRALETRGL
ncbi:MAG: large conductance mechanosensitive channel protein MscL [Kovacikia sp.]